MEQKLICEVEAIVLAGDENDPLASAAGVVAKGGIICSGLPMIQIVVDSLLSSSSVKRCIVIVAPEIQALVKEHPAVKMVKPVGSFSENLAVGIEHLQNWNIPVLLLTGDLPLLNSSIVDQFVWDAQELDADIVYPIVSKKTMLEKYPGARRLFIRLQDGSFTGGNFGLARRPMLKKFQPFIQKIHDARKNPLRLCLMFGLGFLFRLITHRLRICQVEERAGKLIGGTARALTLDSPEIAFDVDKQEDLNLVRGILLEKDQTRS